MKQSPRIYFPLGKAHGKAFCNRVEETKWLSDNILGGKHSLLVAPRRFGKSSLADKAIEQASIPSIKINFHLCVTEEEVAELITSTVVKLIGKSIGPVDQLIASIKKYASNLTPQLSFGGDVAALELIPKQKKNHAVVISESLLLLEKLLQEKNQKAVIFFDEFQEVLNINKGTHIEGAIRTAAQEMQNLSLIFSGSIRSMLLKMFEDEHRPLYKLCRKLKLNRISSMDYEKHIKGISEETWGSPISQQAFEEIMKLSNRHPYYVNYLCDVLWVENEQLPAVDEVRKAWEMVIEEDWGDALKEISSLANSQRKILKFIATNQCDNMTSQETCAKLQMPGSTIASATASLADKDYIELDEAGHYQVINPLLSAVLKAD